MITPLRPHQSKARSSLQLGILLVCSGGFLDAFTYVGPGHVFANAMTGNAALWVADLFLDAGMLLFLIEKGPSEDSG